MTLFELKDNKVTFAPQALELKPFRALWDRDKTKDKKQAVAELSFVYFLCDFESDFQNIIDIETRAEEIASVLLDLKRDFSDSLIKQACNFYIERQNTLSMDLLESAKVGADKLKEFYINFDFSTRDKNGRPLYDPQKIQKMLAELGPTVEGIINLEKRIKREQEEKSSMRGAREKTMFEDGQLAD